jgi:hypothetical protein
MSAVFRHRKKQLSLRTQTEHGCSNLCHRVTVS